MALDLNDAKTLWRSFKSPEFWAEISPSSHISDCIDLNPIEPTSPPDVARFEHDGIGAAHAVPIALAERAARTVSDVHQSGIPPAFAFVYDELWAPAPYVLGHARVLLKSCELRADAWAWVVPAGETGWAGHRDYHGQSADPKGHSEILTVWLALSRVTNDDAAMVVVPRSRDPHWPDSMANAPDPSLGLTLTGDPGDVFYWDGDVYHWSSRGSSTAVGTRMSAAYTLATASGLGIKPSLDPASFGLEQRLDVMAAGIVEYTPRFVAMPTAVYEWALRWDAAANLLAKR